MEQQQAKYEGIANALASRGRGTDTMLLHVSPQEIQYLEAIAPSMGIDLPNGKLPLNPDTGQPEALAFLLPLLAALPGALASGASAGLGIGGAAGGLGAAGTAFASALPASFTGMFTGGLTGLSQGILGSTLTNLIPGLSTTAAETAAVEGAVLGGAEAGLADLGFMPEVGAEALTQSAGAEALGGAVPWSPETLMTAGEAVQGGSSAAEAAQAAGMGAEYGTGAISADTTAAAGLEALGPGPWSTETAVTAGEAVEGGATAAQAAELAMEPVSFMDKVQSGLQAFGEDPLGTAGEWVQKGAQTAIEHPIETAGGIYALDALTADDGGGGEEGDPGETWASQQEGGDPFTYDQPGTGGGQMTAGRDLIADSGVPATSDLGVPSVVDQGLGSMPVGPDTAAPVGLGAAEMADMAGAEEAFDLVQDEGAALEDMSMDEIIASMPADLTMEEIEALLAQFGTAGQGGLYA